MTEKSAPQSVPSYAWVILIVVYLASMAAPLNQFKVPPVMGTLMESYGMSMAVAGTLMSIFALIGVVLALPSGFIMGRIGVKNAGLVALLCLMAGGAVGALAGNIPVLMASRVLEGVGMCLMSIVAPTALATWFPPHKHGLALGVWGTWVPIGSTIAFSIGPTIAAASGWTGVAWGSFGYTTVLFVAFLLLFRMPRAAAPLADSAPAPQGAGMGAVLRQRDPWFLAISFACFMMVTISLMTFLPAYFISTGLDQAAAAGKASIYIIVNMVSIFLGGVISDKLGRKKCIVIPYIIIGGLMAFFFLPGDGIMFSMLAVGILGGFAVTPTFSAAPMLVAPADAGHAMAILALGQNAGMAIGPALFGMFAQNMGWDAAGYFTVPVILLGAFLASRIKVK
ncbi:MFS transporter [Desulfovibrio sp. OttesenSCG-928-C06]|nr:MFS transporter [Desulfovibrio sp. OttesenSCG-928-C06]